MNQRPLCKCFDFTWSTNDHLLPYLLRWVIQTLRYRLSVWSIHRFSYSFDSYTRLWQLKLLNKGIWLCIHFVTQCYSVYLERINRFDCNCVYECECMFVNIRYEKSSNVENVRIWNDVLSHNKGKGKFTLNSYWQHRISVQFTSRRELKRYIHIYLWYFVVEFLLFHCLFKIFIFHMAMSNDFLSEFNFVKSLPFDSMWNNNSEVKDNNKDELIISIINFWSVNINTFFLSSFQFDSVKCLWHRNQQVFDC